MKKKYECVICGLKTSVKTGKTQIMPFDLTKELVYNKKNIGKYRAESNLKQFFD